MAKRSKQEVLLSYDFLPIFEKLVEKGNPLSAAELVIAIIRYDKDGTEPAFSDDGVCFVWETVIKPKLDGNKKAYEEVVKARKEAGRMGGNAKSENNQNVANVPIGSFANQNNQMVANLPDNDNDNDNDNVIVNDLKKEKVKKEKNADAENGFDVFWKHYPRHDSKQKAREAYVKVLKKGITLDVLVAAIERHKQTRQWQENNGQYIPYPSTWLNQQRWEDEPTIFSTKSGNPKNDVQAGYQRMIQILGGKNDNAI